MKGLQLLFHIALILILLHSCSNQRAVQNTPEEDIETIKDHARETIAMTFGTLSGELKATMTAGGVHQAIEYCSLNAIALTDSLAHLRKVKIKRATDRPRNPINLLSIAENNIFNYYQNAISNNLSYSDTLVIYPKQRTYYAPILINNLCLRCHGNSKDIEEYNFIKDRYKEDMAVGYSIGDLRGIWCVSYNSEHVNN